jgi:hypothetical protein
MSYCQVGLADALLIKSHKNCDLHIWGSQNSAIP